MVGPGMFNQNLETECLQTMKELDWHLPKGANPVLELLKFAWVQVDNGKTPLDMEREYKNTPYAMEQFSQHVMTAERAPHFLRLVEDAVGLAEEASVEGLDMDLPPAERAAHFLDLVAMEMEPSQG